MGEVFAGRYELIDPVAAGGMGTVWRVHDRQDGRVKAAKILRQSDASTLLRFLREQAVRIDHEHVVTPQSWAGMDERVLFTMPLVRGGSVGTLLKRYDALAAYWVVTLADQALAALEAIHAAQVVHRDIKPGNLLLEPTGRGTPHLRVTDFGIAVAADEPRLTRVATVIGTPGYMAPEQRRGGDPDPRSDVYAVGVVMHEMATGIRPAGEEATAPFALASGRPLDAALSRVIGAATALDPAERPDAAGLRTLLRESGLVGIGRAPDDPVDIVDEFALVRDVATLAGPPATPPTRPSPQPAPVTAPGSGDTPLLPPPPPPVARPVVLPAYLLLAAGLLCLLGAGWLLLG